MSRSSKGQGVTALLAVFVVALNLRPALASLGPVLESIRNDLHLSHGQAGLLTTLPVLCMGVFSPLAMRLNQRFGLWTAVLISTLLIGAATVLRGMGTFVALLISAVGAGAGIAVLSPLLSMFVKQAYPQRSARVSSWTTSALCFGAGLAAAVSAPLTRVLGWPNSLASWCVLALLAVVLWWLMVPRTLVVAASNSSYDLPWQRPRAWLLMVIFGLHSVIFYVLLAWVAPAYIEFGKTPAEAGHLLGLFAIMQVAGTLLVSILPVQQRERRPAILFCSGCMLFGLAGLWINPLFLPELMMCLLGAGTAGFFSLMLILPLDYSESPTAAGAWTAMMCGGGYVIAATGPVLAGWLRDHSTGYHSVFLLLMALSALVFMGCLFLTPANVKSA
jgi:CP family cyanate transporter-like MFS transporter